MKLSIFGLLCALLVLGTSQQGESTSLTYIVEYEEEQEEDFI